MSIKFIETVNQIWLLEKLTWYQSFVSEGETKFSTQVGQALLQEDYSFLGFQGKVNFFWIFKEMATGLRFEDRLEGASNFSPWREQCAYFPLVTPQMILLSTKTSPGTQENNQGK